MFVHSCGKSAASLAGYAPCRFPSSPSKRNSFAEISAPPESPYIYAADVMLRLRQLPIALSVQRVSLSFRLDSSLAARCNCPPLSEVSCWPGRVGCLAADVLLRGVWPSARTPVCKWSGVRIIRPARSGIYGTAIAKPLSHRWVPSPPAPYPLASSASLGSEAVVQQPHILPEQYRSPTSHIAPSFQLVSCHWRYRRTPHWSATNRYAQQAGEQEVGTCCLHAAAEVAAGASFAG